MKCFSFSWCDSYKAIQHHANDFFISSFFLILLVAAAARLVVLFLFADIDPVTANVWEYGEIARHYHAYGQLARVMTTGDGSEFIYPTAFMPPLMIWLWVLLFNLFGDTSIALVAMLGVNYFLSLGIIVLTGMIALQLIKDRLVALLAMAILAIYPTFVFSVATYHAIQIYLFPFLLAITIALGTQKPLPRHAVVLGLIGGLAALARTEYVVLFAALYAATFVPWRHLRLFLLATSVSAVVVLPWTVRNYLVFDAFIPIANSSGFNLYKGFNPLANGSGDWVDNNASLVRGVLITDRLDDVKLDEHYEKTRDDVYREFAVRYIKDNPVRAIVVLGLKKVVLFWIFDIYDSMAWNPLYQIAFWPIFLASLAGFGLLIKDGFTRDRRFRMLLVLFATQSLVIIFYAVHLRYRMNIEPILFIFAAYFFVCLLRRYVT